MCNNFPNIKVVEGNAFSVLVPLKVRTFESCRPIDEDIDPTKLTNVVFKFGGVSYTPIVDERGVAAVLPATLSRGTYDIVVTADYEDNPIRAAYEGAITIVPWNSQSDAQQYLPGSPIVLEAAYIIGGALTDAELEALKEEYREKNAQLDQAIADAEEAKREWEERAAELDGVAQEQTLTDGVTAIREDISHIDIDTSTLAKQGTNESATLTATQTAATNAMQYAEDAKQAANDAKAAALALPSAQEIAQAVVDAVTIQVTYDGVVYLTGYEGRSPLECFANIAVAATSIVDDTITQSNTSSYPFRIHLAASLSYLEMKKLTTINAAYGLAEAKATKMVLPELVATNIRTFLGCTNLEELEIPQCTGTDSIGLFTSCANLIKIETGAAFNNSSSFFSTWSPTNALSNSSSSLVKDGETFANNLEKLLYNIRTYIAANLPDRTGLSTLTISFSAAVKAAILADTATANAFTNKNWTIA